MFQLSGLSTVVPTHPPELASVLSTHNPRHPASVSYQKGGVVTVVDLNSGRGLETNLTTVESEPVSRALAISDPIDAPRRYAYAILVRAED